MIPANPRGAGARRVGAHTVPEGVFLSLKRAGTGLLLGELG
jgi:hypothetical protein